MHAFLLFSFLPLGLIGHHLFNESRVFIDGEGEECSSSSGIYMPLQHGCKPLIKVLEHELVFHSMVWVGLDVILEPFPFLGDGFE